MRHTVVSAWKCNDALPGSQCVQHLRQRQHAFTGVAVNREGWSALHLAVLLGFKLNDNYISKVNQLLISFN